jgi:class 3 adenylate cyclase
MPIYMDVHNKAQGATVNDVVQAHSADLQVQGKYGVRYLRYWFNREAGKIFCLIDAPSVVAAVSVHENSHGMLPDEIIEVEKTLVQAFLGSAEESEDIGPNTIPPDLAWEDVPAGPGGQPVLDTALRTILFTDLEGSTQMTQRLGDEAAHSLVREHNAIVRAALRDHRGSEVKTIGDAFMVCFVSPRQAVECAIAIQRGLREHAKQQPEHAMRVRVGLSVGEPVEEKQDFYGAAVQLAARACAHAKPDQILAASVVRDLCIGKMFSFIDVGGVPLKGFAEPVQLYEVQWCTG